MAVLGDLTAFRIPAAMPRSGQGRLATTDGHRKLAPGRRVVLAGDSLAWPWSDSAAFSGEWAADRGAGARRVGLTG